MFLPVALVAAGLGFLSLGSWKHFSFSCLMDEITIGWNRMTLQGPEDGEFDLRLDMGPKEFILAMRFFTKRVLNIDAIAQNFSQLW